MMKKISDEMMKTLEGRWETLPLDKIYQDTGLRLNLLLRHLDRRGRRIRHEIWDRVYPALRPYLLLTTNETASEQRPVRIGAPARMTSDYIDLDSDKKILLDAFGALAEKDRRSVLVDWKKAAPGASPARLKKSTDMENELVGCFDALDEASRQTLLSELIGAAVAQMRRHRRGA
ncbi:MAG: hypothetical protein PHS41_11110 [Victivallaceae bacterium]|nr:hypothetical protein [Victivallaceae bacterium]